jgi:ABC-type glutathione transport system ATPase component
VQTLDQQVAQRLERNGVHPYTRGRRIGDPAPSAAADGPRSAHELFEAARPATLLAVSIAHCAGGGGTCHPPSRPPGITRYELAEWAAGHHHHVVCAVSAEASTTSTSILPSRPSSSAWWTRHHRTRSTSPPPVTLSKSKAGAAHVGERRDRPGRGVSAAYGANVGILESSDFVIPEAAITALIGPNGSGKSTLLSVMAGSPCPEQRHASR